MAAEKALGARPVGDGRASLYRLAYEQGLRTLEDQRDELNGLRTRACSFIAFVGSATAFLVGTSVGGLQRTDTFRFLAFSATAATFLAIACLILVLRPRTFDLRLSPKTLVERWIERSVPKPSEEDLLRGLAVVLDEMQAGNVAKLAWIRAWYLGLIGFGAIGLSLWTMLVWMNA